MKKKPIPIKIFSFSHPMVQAESLSVLGDKYKHALPFEWEVVSDLTQAQIIAWDGVVSLKNQLLVDQILTEVKKDKVLLLIRESMTLLKDHSIVKLYEPHEINYVEVSGWGILPEEILAALNECYKKLKHV